MTKFLIFLRLKSGHHIPKVGNFIYSEEYQKYLYLGVPTALEDFNEAAEQTINNPPANFNYSFGVEAMNVKGKDSELPADGPSKADKKDAEITKLKGEISALEEKLNAKEEVKGTVGGFPLDTPEAQSQLQANPHLHFSDTNPHAPGGEPILPETDPEAAAEREALTGSPDRWPLGNEEAVEPLPEPSEVGTGGEKYRVDGKKVFKGDQQVGGLYNPGPHFRTSGAEVEVSDEERDEIVEFLKSKERIPQS